MLCGFVLGAAAMLFSLSISADESGGGSFVRVPDMQWKGQESHGPKTSLKWILGRQSDIKMGAMETFWTTQIGKGGYNKPHKHSDEEQVYYILKGTGKLVIDGREIAVQPGDVAYFPVNVEHALYNEGDGDLQFVAVGAKVK